MFQLHTFLIVYERLLYITGSFEREVLKHFDSIVERSLPIEKVKKYYNQSPGTGKQVILDYVTFFEERKMVSKYSPFVIFITWLYLCFCKG